jgi:aspartate carbamoyltransferase catalytic subunit
MLIVKVDVNWMVRVRVERSNATEEVEVESVSRSSASQLTVEIAKKKVKRFERPLEQLFW